VVVIGRSEVVMVAERIMAEAIFDRLIFQDTFLGLVVLCSGTWAARKAD
jgi:hypothetical protein